jgi:histidine triad (HIT) family protein
MEKPKTKKDKGSTMTDCLFCKIRDGEIPGDIVYEDDDILAFRDVNPQAPTHILIIPKKHIATINDLEDADIAVSGRMMLVAKQIAADEGIDQEGYRLVFNCNEGAGQAVFHIHMHVLGGRGMSWPPG